MEIFDEKYGQYLNEKKCIYLYIEYVGSIGDRLYCYRTDDDSILVGDYVLVDRAGNEITGKVINKKYYKKDEVPYPLDKTKFVISKTNNLNYDVEDDKGFRFIGYKILKINNFITIGLVKGVSGSNVLIIDGCFARNEFYSLGIDDKDELKALYDMLNY